MARLIGIDWEQPGSIAGGVNPKLGRFNYRRFTVRTFLRIRGALVLLMALAASGEAVRADEIDVDLSKHGDKLVAALRKRGYQNVGVLNFQIKRHNGPVNMHVGRLNGAMATRLENVLILELLNYDDPRPGVVCNAGTAAIKNARDAKDKNDPNYKDEEGRKRLFRGLYPLAWGEKQVPVDAFLTGLIHFSKDLTKARVTIQIFDHKQPAKMNDLLTFETDTTLGMLGDMGLSFAVRGLADGGKAAGNLATKEPVVAKVNMSKAILSGLLPPEPPIEGVAPAVTQKTDPKPKTVEPKEEIKPAVAEVMPFTDKLKFEVYYDGERQEFTHKLKAPAKNQRVHFEVVNVTKKDLGLVLRINGVNTLDNDPQRKDADRYARWVLAPGERYGIYGFYRRHKEAQAGQPNADFVPFKASDIEDIEDHPALAEEAKIGKIEVDVFVPAKEEPIRTTNTRSLSEPLKPGKTFEDVFNGVVDAEKRAITLPEGSRALILTDKENAAKVTLGQQRFTGTLAVHATIQYEQPRTSGRNNRERR
jgi:hypothetical protein